MSRRTGKKRVEEVPVDKLDTFLKDNYIKILTVAASLIVVIIAVYGVSSLMGSNKTKKLDVIGSYEVRGLNSKEAIEAYSALANDYGFARDYIHYQAGTSLLALGDKEAAIAELEKVGGNYKTFADSLLYDLRGGDIPASAFTSEFSPVWFYRAALTASDEERLEMFKAKWPDSALLAQLEKWGE